MTFVVAIDGPAGSGKGTVTKLVSEKLGLQDFQVGTDNGYSDHKVCRANIVLGNI